MAYKKGNFEEDLKVLKQSDPLTLPGDNAIIVKKYQRVKDQKEFIDIRRYYMDDAGHYKPTAKGIFLPISDEDDKHFSITIANLIVDFSGKRIPSEPDLGSTEDFDRENSNIEEG